MRGAAVIGQGVGHADGRSFNVTEAARPATRGGVGRASGGFFKRGNERGWGSWVAFRSLSLSVSFDAYLYRVGVVAVATDV